MKNSVTSAIRILMAIFLIEFFLSLPVANAQEVTVDGVGTNRDSAIKDARRIAVEQGIGTFLDSRTLVRNSMVELDEILTKSQGYVGNVTVLEEHASGGSYYVKARIVVQDRPSPELLQQVQAVIALNDPRIAIAVLREGQNTHENIIEAAMTERLVSLGFQHVVDVNVVAALQNARMLESLYDGKPISGIGSSYGADFIVLGKCNMSTNKISYPDFKGGYKTTNISTGHAEMTTKIIRLDTGDILETFTLEGQGAWNSGDRAEQETLKDMAGKAAKKVEEKFRTIAARSSGSVQITATARNYENLQKLADDLRNVPGVQNVFIREQSNGRAIIELDTNQSANNIINMLKKQTSLGIYADSITGNSAKIIVS